MMKKTRINKREAPDQRGLSDLAKMLLEYKKLAPTLPMVPVKIPFDVLEDAGFSKGSFVRAINRAGGGEVVVDLFEYELKKVLPSQSDFLVDMPGYDEEEALEEAKSGTFKTLGRVYRVSRYDLESNFILGLKDKSGLAKIAAGFSKEQAGKKTEIRSLLIIKKAGESIDIIINSDPNYLITVNGRKKCWKLLCDVADGTERPFAEKGVKSAIDYLNYNKRAELYYYRHELTAILGIENGFVIGKIPIKFTNPQSLGRLKKGELVA